MRRFLFLVSLLGLCAVPSLVRAETNEADDEPFEWPEWIGPPLQSGTSMLMGPSLYVGYLMERGANEATTSEKGYSAPRLNAVTYWERQGLTSGMLTGILLAAATSVRGFLVKDVSYEKHGDTWYRHSTYYTEQERREIGEAGAELGASVADSGGSSAFELTVYSRSLSGGGDGTGYKLNFLFGTGIGENFLLEYGYGFGSIRAYGEELETKEKVEFRSSYFGVPLRFSWAAPWFVLYAQWDLNLMSFFSSDDDQDQPKVARIVDANRSPVRLGGQANLFGRVFLDLAAVTPSLISGDIGWRLAAGARF